MQMARRLTSFIELRNVPPEYRNNPASFIVADDRAIAYRQQASRWTASSISTTSRSSAATSPTSTKSGR